MGSTGRRSERKGGGSERVSVACRPLQGTYQAAGVSEIQPCARVLWGLSVDLGHVIRRVDRACDPRESGKGVCSPREGTGRVLPGRGDGARAPGERGQSTCS